MREFFKDESGKAASVTRRVDGGYQLTIIAKYPGRETLHNMQYSSRDAALKAMGKLGDNWSKRGEWR